MNRWRGKWALVTGASAGIGKAIAEELASGGTHLVLSARRADRLLHLARVLATRHQIRAEVCVVDLATATAPQQIYAFTKERAIAVDLLVNNAGFGSHGEFFADEPARLLDMVQVNCGAVVGLTRLFLPDMVARKRGDVLIVASTAAFQAVPYISTYAATKAFDLLLAEGLAEEMKPYGIRVCALCPGSTESEFHEVARQTQFAAKHRQESAGKVARTGLAALRAGRSFVISGFATYLGANSQRMVPRRLVTRIAARMFRPSSKA